jgi:D-glycero-alpha-D-manno-heptose-7-phosphate kinase
VRLAVDLEDFGRRIVLAFTGSTRNSGINNWDVMVRRINGDSTAVRAFDLIRDAAGSLRDGLEHNDWHAVGRHLAAEWEARKQLAPGVTTPEIETLLDAARSAGALAGKVCGAGGGGCLFCLVTPESKQDVEAVIRAAGATVLPFQFEADGLRVSRQ